MKFKKCKQTVDLSNYSVIIIFITTQDPFSILYIYRVDLWTFSDWLDGVKTSKIKEKKNFMSSQNILFSGIFSTERTCMEQNTILIVISKKKSKQINYS